MVTNRTVKNYFPGSTIDVIIDLDINHGGYFEFELCSRDSFDVPESENCFQRLKFVDGSERMPLKADHSKNGFRSMSLLMPPNLRECRACVLRWNYRAGNNWGVCQDGSEAIGCGPQELYRNCADISIGYQIHMLDGELGLRSLLLTQASMDTSNSVSKASKLVEEKPL